MLLCSILIPVTKGYSTLILLYTVPFNHIISKYTWINAIIIMSDCIKIHWSSSRCLCRNIYKCRMQCYYFNWCVSHTSFNLACQYPSRSVSPNINLSITGSDISHTSPQHCPHALTMCSFYSGFCHWLVSWGFHWIYICSHLAIFPIFHMHCTHCQIQWLGLFQRLSVGTRDLPILIESSALPIKYSHHKALPPVEVAVIMI